MQTTSFKCETQTCYFNPIQSYGVTQKSTTTASTSNNSGSETFIVSLLETFQTLSFLDTKSDPITQKLWKIFSKKHASALGQDKNAREFKDALSGVLNDLIVRVEDSSNVQFIKSLQHDLKHHNLVEISQKYYGYQASEWTGIRGELAPFLGDQSKIKALAKQEAESLPSTLLSHLELQPVNRDSLMALMVEQKRKAEPDFNCYIVDQCDFAACLESLKNSKKALNSQRIQILVRSDVHYTAVDIEYKNRVFQAAVMDAAKDERCKTIAAQLKQYGCKDLYIVGLEDQIQFDSYNCAFFSFDSVWQSYKKPDFFKLLQSLPSTQTGEWRSIAWKSMPPEFVRNATSTTFMKNYPAKNSAYKASKTFESYVNQHMGKRDLGNQIFRDMHTVLEDRVKKQAPKIKKLIKSLSPEELLEAANSRFAQAFIRSFLALK